jgi:octaprenyl-diphosphate synthase
MATTSVCYGEMLQVATRFYFDMKPDMYFKIVKHKTSAMFSAACLLGAINNGAPEGLKKNLAGFGNNFGMAFQLVDDCADILGHSKIEGKSLGVDLQKGEFTFPIVMLLRYAKCAKFLQDLLKLDITIQERKRKIKVLINQHHLKPVILKYIKRFTNMALQRLGNLQIPGVKYLEHLTNYLNNRANTLLTNLK